MSSLILIGVYVKENVEDALGVGANICANLDYMGYNVNLINSIPMPVEKVVKTFTQSRNCKGPCQHRKFMLDQGLNRRCVDCGRLKSECTK